MSETKNSQKFGNYSKVDAISLLISTAVQLKNAGHPVEIAQKNGRIAILATGFMMDESGSIMPFQTVANPELRPATAAPEPPVRNGERDG